MTPVKITYFSDLLCVWAYVAEIRLKQIVQEFGDQVVIDARFCSIFADAHGKIETGWADRGSYAGFNKHVCEVAARFPHITVSDRLWIDVKPRTSASAHLFLKAVQIVEEEDVEAGGPKPPFLETLYNKAACELRRAFFQDALDIALWEVQRDVGAKLGMDLARIEKKIHSSEAIARLSVDFQQAEKNRIDGSPTFLMNDGRQKLFGNVGYRLIEANIQEFLRAPAEDEASWC